MKRSKPYPIILNLRQIKNILQNDEYMDVNCFNMAIRILACHEVQLMRDIPSHYMDLKFCVSYYTIYVMYYILPHNTNAFVFYFSQYLTMHETHVMVKLWTLLS